MIANAQADGTGVRLYTDVDEPPNDSVKPGEVLILIPQAQEEIRFTVPIGVWQGNGS